MRYLSGGRDKRLDPSVLLSDARSVISVAVNYYSEAREEENRERSNLGVFSIYSHGRDYHEILSAMLGELQGKLEERFPGVRSVICVDTQPISERDFAVRSGVGWLGKNTCVISPEFGSWIFLGELVTSLELEPDEPLETLCGTCTRCTDACPTGALNEPFFLDATRCISYLTIEKRGEIDSEFHDSIGRYIFGCDECQIVCPFNNHPQETTVFVGSPNSRLMSMTVDELVNISDEEFRDRARHSAIGRCKPAGIRRNALIVRENLKSDDDRFVDDATTA